MRSPSPALLALLLAVPAAAQAVKLNGPLAQPVGGNIQSYLQGTSGSRVVYLGDQDEDGLLELYSAPLDGSAPPVKLNPPVSLGHTTLGRSYIVDASCTRAAFLVGSQIHSAPTDGSAPAVTLTNSIGITDRDNFGFLFSPDGAWVLYREDTPVYSLHAVPADGSLAPTELSAPFAGFIDQFEVSPDSTRAVFLRSSTGGRELFSAPLDGSAPAVRLSAPLPFNGSVVSFDLAPASDRVLYVADQNTDEVFELFSVPIDGSVAPVRVSGPMTAGGDIGPVASFAFAIAADGTRALYQADQELDERFELYSAPLDGSGAPVKLSGPLADDRDVSSFQGTPDGRSVVFLADRDTDEVTELFVVPADGSRPPGKLNARLVTGGDVRGFRITADSTQVVYRADQDVAGRTELYAAPLEHARRAGEPRVVRLNAPLGPGASVAFTFLLSLDGRRAIYKANLLADGRSGFFSVSVRGGPSLAPEPAPSAQAFLLPAPDGRGLFLGDLEGTGGSSLYSWPLVGGAPVRLNADLTLGPVLGDVWNYRTSGDHALYLADQEEHLRLELYRVPVDGSALPLRLSAPLVAGGSVSSFALSADGMRVAYVADQDVNDRVELYGMPSDGSVPPVRLSGTPLPVMGVQAGPLFSPDGERVVYRAFRNAQGTVELLSARFDASGEPVALSGSLPGAADVEPDFVLSLDGSRALFRADGSTVDKLELYSTPVDGSGPRVRLSANLISAGDVLSFLLEPLGAYVVYWADAAIDGTYELYRVPVAGGTAVRLNPPLVAGGTVSGYRITSDGQRVVYLADQEENERYELFSVPLAGGASVKLNGTLVTGGDVGTNGRFGDLAPDGTRVAYTADANVDGMVELFVAPVDGSSPAVAVSGTFGAGGGVTDPSAVRFTPDGRRIVFVARATGTEPARLMIVRVDGAGGPLVLNPPDTRVVSDFVLDASGFQALYRTQLPGDVSMRELFRVALDGAPRAELLTSNPSGVLGYDFTPDQRRVVFHADMETAGVLELFSTRLERLPRPAR